MTNSMLVIALAALFLADAALTIYALRYGAREDAGWTRKMIESVGRDRWLILSKLTAIAALWWARDVIPAESLWYFLGFYSMLCINNARVLHGARKRFLQTHR